MDSPVQDRPTLPPSKDLDPSLSRYGWDPFFARQWPAWAGRGLVPARVVEEQRGSYRVRDRGGEHHAVLGGRLRHRVDAGDDRPAVGDWVALARSPAGGAAVIHGTLERRTRISRNEAGRRTREQVVAANVDTLLLVMGLDGDYNLRRLERFATMAWQSGAEPLVVLNKADLRTADQLAAATAEVEAAAPGMAVLAVSCAAGTGLDGLRGWLVAGRTLALTGSSGVGKSTLINRLWGRDVLRTGAVREGDDRGRHTTTHRQLLRLPSGALLIDTPGMRELQLWGDDDGLSGAFDDVERLAERCRFRDCRHVDEPGCAVLRAAADGSLSSARLDSYRRLQRELYFLELRQDEAARRVEKRRIAAIHKAAKKHKPRL